MSLTKATYSMISGAPVNVLDYGAVGDGVTDDTVALQNAINASKNKKLFFPSGVYKITSALTLDPAFNYYIEGEGRNPGADAVSTIVNAGTGNAIEIITAGTDNLFYLKDFGIRGNMSSGAGIVANNAAQLTLENLWVTNHGFHGVKLTKCYNARVKNCVISQNGQHGLWLDEQCNNVTVLTCLVNGNARKDGGYANIAVIGTSGKENLSVSLIGCDFTAAGLTPITTVTSAYNLIIQYTNSINVFGCYSEAAVTDLVYSDSSAHCISFANNYMQDGRVYFENSPQLLVQGNTFFRNTVNTSLTVSAVSGNNSRINQNYFSNGATESYSGTILSPSVQWSTAPPSGGTWKVSDVVYNSTPASGQPQGWVCTVAGTPGTWKAMANLA